MNQCWVLTKWETEGSLHHAVVSTFTLTYSQSTMHSSEYRQPVTKLAYDVIYHQSSVLPVTQSASASCCLNFLVGLLFQLPLQWLLLTQPSLLKHGSRMAKKIQRPPPCTSPPTSLAYRSRRRRHCLLAPPGNKFLPMPLVSGVNCQRCLAKLADFLIMTQLLFYVA